MASYMEGRLKISHIQGDFNFITCMYHFQLKNHFKIILACLKAYTLSFVGNSFMLIQHSIFKELGCQPNNFDFFSFDALLVIAYFKVCFT